MKTMYQLLKLLSIFLLILLHPKDSNAQCFSLEGGAIINEFSNGPIKNQEFIELLVIGNGNPGPVNLQGYIIDDNNEAKTNVGNEPGHIRLGSCFNSVEAGTLILIYNDIQTHPKIADIQHENTIVIPFSDPCIIKMEGCPNHKNPNFDCPEGFQITDPDANWVAFIAAHNYGDKIQILDPNKESVHEFEWGLPVPSKAYSTQRKAYVHSKDYKYEWVNDSQSSPGYPNGYQNYLFIESIKNLNEYQSLEVDYNLEGECSAVSITVTGGIKNYEVELYRQGQGLDDYHRIHYSTSNTGNFSYSNLNCGGYRFEVTDMVGCKVEIEFSIAEKTECNAKVFNNGDYYLGDQCGSCDGNQNECYQWYTSNGSNIWQKSSFAERFEASYGDPLAAANDYVIRKEFDRHTGELLNESKFYFKQNDNLGGCDATPNNCNDTDGDGICNDEDSCPESQDNDDSDWDGVCDINDCDPNNGAASVDSDGDGVCDNYDCAPNDPNFYQDSDGDGVCDSEDCQPLNSFVYYGGPCNDGSPCTKNDTYDKNCDCIGLPINNCDEDCVAGRFCDDNDPCTKNDKFDINCNCIGEIIINCNECEEGTLCDDNNPCTKDDVFNDLCGCEGTPILNCQECEAGYPCDDNNDCTLNDVFDNRCNCKGTPIVNVSITREFVAECFGEIRLIAEGGNESYKWYKDGDYLNIIESSIIIFDPGEYKVVTYSSEQCEFSEVITISEEAFSQFIEIVSSSTSICNNIDPNISDPITLSVSDSYESYRWFYEGELMPDNSGKNEMIVSREGKYKVETIDELQCPKTGEFFLKSKAKPVIIEPQNPVFCPGVPVNLSITSTNSFASIIWTKPDGSQQSGASISANMVGDYTVSVISTQGCTATDVVTFDSEEKLDIDAILTENGFAKERVLIVDITPALKDEKDNDNRSSQSGGLNVDNVDGYQIKRVEADPESEAVDLEKFAQARIDKHYCYDQNVQGLLVDNFCPENNNGYSLSDFIEFSNQDAAFTFYIRKEAAGEVTTLYFKNLSTTNHVLPIGHKKLFKEVLYSILCNKQNGLNTVLDKPAISRFTEITPENNPGSISNYIERNVNYIESGRINLPNVRGVDYPHPHSFWADENLGIDPIHKLTFHYGVLISNYRQGGELETGDLNSISYVPTKSAIITRDREKDYVELKGNYYKVNIKYKPNSLELLYGQLEDGENCYENEYLSIYIPYSTFDSHGNLENHDRMNGLLFYLDDVIDYADNNYGTLTNYYLKQLPLCLYSEDQICTFFGNKFKKFSTLFNGPLSTVNEIISNPLNNLKPNFSENLIKCIDENNYVDDYYNLGSEWYEGDRVNFLESLTKHFFKVNPSYSSEIDDTNEDYIHLIDLVKINDDELEDKLLYKTILNDDELIYSNFWKSNYKLYYDGPGGQGTYSLSSITLNQSNSLRYFDKNKSTVEKEPYYALVGKEYNYLKVVEANVQDPIYIDDQYQLVKVPGIYIAYALNKKKYDQAVEATENLVDLAAIALSFGELAPLVYASRIARVRAGLALGEITTSGANLFLRNSEWCEGINKEFCDEWRIYTQRAQMALLAGQGSAFFYSKYLNTRKVYDGLDDTQKKALEDALPSNGSNGGQKAAFIKQMSSELDLLKKLKEALMVGDDFNYSILVDEVFVAVTPNEMKLFEFVEEINKLDLDQRKAFLNDLYKTATKPGKIGKELGSLSDEVVKAWKNVLDAPFAVRTNKAFLSKIDELSTLGFTISELKKIGDIAKRLGTKYGDDVFTLKVCDDIASTMKNAKIKKFDDFGININMGSSFEDLLSSSHFKNSKADIGNLSGQLRVTSKDNPGFIEQINEGLARMNSTPPRDVYIESVIKKGDIVDDYLSEAIQLKALTSINSGKISQRLTSSVNQFISEIPPIGYKKIAEVRVLSSGNPVYNFSSVDLKNWLQTGVDNLNANNLLNYQSIDKLRIKTGLGVKDFKVNATGTVIEL